MLYCRETDASRARWQSASESTLPVTTLAHKVKLQPGMRGCLLGAPKGYLTELATAHAAQLSRRFRRGPFDWMHIFVRTQSDLASIAPRLKGALKPAGLLWIAFPKRTFRNQTDLTRDEGWDALRPLDLKWVNLISVNETWSAFALRPYKTGEEHRS